MKVSVIIPCYNVENYISECIESVMAQSHSDIEIICVNDGSSDKSQQIIEKIIEEKDGNIRLINQENGGASSARNHGLTVAEGEYIQFLDADDLLSPSKIAHQIKLVQEYKNPDMVIGSYERMNEQGEITYERVYNSEDRKRIWALLMHTDLGNTCANLFKAELFRNDIHWNPALRSSQEYNLMFSILQRQVKVCFDGTINTTIRIRESGSISQTNKGANWERYVDLRIRIVQFLRENSLVRNEHYQLLFDAIRMLYPYNKIRAKEAFRKYLPKGFKPSPTTVTGASYIRLYKLLGFSGTEIIRSVLKKK